MSEEATVSEFMEDPCPAWTAVGVGGLRPPTAPVGIRYVAELPEGLVG